jgi:hypothetical protein
MRFRKEIKKARSRILTAPFAQGGQQQIEKIFFRFLTAVINSLVFKSNQCREFVYEIWVAAIECNENLLALCIATRIFYAIECGLKPPKVRRIHVSNLVKPNK